MPNKKSLNVNDTAEEKAQLQNLQNLSATSNTVLSLYDSRFINTTERCDQFKADMSHNWPLSFELGS